MKNVLLVNNFLLIFFLLNTAFGQEKESPKEAITQENEPPQAAKVNLKDFKLGFAIGPSFNLGNTYSPYLTGDSNRVQLQKLSFFSLKLSTSLVFNRKFIYKVKAPSGDNGNEALTTNNSKNQALVAKGLKEGELYEYPSKFSYVVTLNIAELSNGSLGVNKTIEGGIGVGLRVSPAFHIVGLFGFANIRELRNEYNKPGHYIKIPGGSSGQILNALDETDEKYFFTRIIPSLSFRFIYVFGDEDPQFK